jgi:SAC3 family protein LENG8/THP3
VRTLLRTLTPGERDHAFVAHALAVRAAAAIGDYDRFFRLYASAPNHGRYVMDLVAHRIRLEALRRMADA